MNPSYGRALSSRIGTAPSPGAPRPPDGDDDDAQECAKHGELQHVNVHVQRDGGFSVHAHYRHHRAGRHSVESRHGSSDGAAEEAKRHLRGHEARKARRPEAAEDSIGE